MTYPLRKTLKGRRAVVLGDGIGGLAAAASLAVRGARVSVLPDPSGASADSLRKGEYRFDFGESLLGAPMLLGELFASADYRISDFLTLKKFNPAARVVLDSGKKVDLWGEPWRLAAELAKADKRAGEKLPRLIKSFRRDGAVLEDLFLRQEGPGKGAVLHPSALLRYRSGMLSPQSLHHRLRRRGGPLISDICSAHLMISLGIDPATAPPILGGFEGLFWEKGAWYPEGGFGALREALARLCEVLRVRIHEGARAEKIEVRSGRLYGVAATGIKNLRCSILVATGDPVKALALTGKREELEGMRQRLERQGYSPSMMTWFLGVRKSWPLLERPQTVFLSPNVREEARQVIDWRVPSAEPTLLVSNPAAIDEGAAPGGRSALSIRYLAPRPSKRWKWTEERFTEERDRVLERLEKAGLKGLMGAIEEEDRRTPLDLEASGLPEGAAFGLRWDRRRFFLFPPRNRVPDLAGLYVAGGFAGPGAPPAFQVLEGMAMAVLAAEDAR